MATLPLSAPPRSDQPSRTRRRLAELLRPLLRHSHPAFPTGPDAQDRDTTRQHAELRAIRSAREAG